MSAVIKPDRQMLADCDRWLVARRGQEPSWLTALRARAFELYQQIGLPTSRDERWRYTSLAPLDPDRLRPAYATDVVLSPADLPVPLGRWRLVFVDGCPVPALSQLEGLPAGVTLMPWAGHAERLASHLASEPQDGLQALHRVWMRDGASVSVAPGVALEQPLELLYIAASAGATYLSNVVDVGSGAHVTVIERFISHDGAKPFSSSITRINIGESAVAEHYSLLEQHESAAHYGVVEVEQAQGSRWQSLVLALGWQWLRSEVSQRFAGSDAASEHNGLFLLRGRQHADLQLRVDHAVPRCTSRANYRGIASQRARGVFDGRVVVRPAAQRTDAHLRSHNLLLSADAEIDCKPQLEILADDVKCGHGATIGQLDDDALFYLRARGLAPALARSLMMFAFANEIVAGIANDDVRRYGLEQIMARMPQGRELRALVAS